MLHGLGRTRAAMWYLERSLAEAGYKVHNIGYSSLDDDMDEIVAVVASELKQRRVARAPKVHFVGHSMGGLVARAYLAKHRLKNLGRVVLMATPNQGSPVIDRINRAGIQIMPIGPAGRSLGSGDGDLPAQLPPPYYEVGVIAGTNDILVPPDHAKLDEGMTDFLELNTGHAWMRYKPEAAKQVVAFLKNGKFDR